MDKQKASFEITPPLFTDKKEAALQIIEGQWDEVFSYLLTAIGDKAREDGSIEEGAAFRERLLNPDTGIEAWKSFVSQAKQYGEDRLNELFTRYSLQDFSTIIEEIHRIKAGREKALEPARGSAFWAAVDQVMNSSETRAQIEAVPEEQPYAERLATWKAVRDEKYEALEAARAEYHQLEEGAQPEASDRIEELQLAYEAWNKERSDNSVNTRSPREVKKAEIRKEVESVLRETPPAINESAWENHQPKTTYAFDGRTFRKLKGHEYSRDDEHMIIDRPLKGNLMTLSATLTKELNEAREVSDKAQEQGSDLLDYKLVQRIVQEITGAAEHLSAMDMWETMKKYHLPAKEVAKILVESKGNVGVMFWLYREKGEQLPLSLQADLLAEMVGHSPKTTMALVGQFIEANMADAKEGDSRDELEKEIYNAPLAMHQVNRLLGYMKNYEGYGDWARQLLDTQFDQLPLEQKISMTDTVLDEFGTNFIDNDLFSEDGLFTDLVAAWEKLVKPEAHTDADFDRKNKADQIVKLALKSLEEGEREGQSINVDQILKALMANKEVIAANADFTHDTRTEDLRRKLTAEKGGYGAKVDYREKAEVAGLVHNVKAGGMFSKKVWQWNLKDMA